MAEILYESYYGVMPLSTNYIEHHGVKGQKHGVRRWQNHDGSLTPDGRIHYGVGPARNSARTDNDRISRIVGKKTEEEQARDNVENHRQLKQYRLEELTNAIANSKFSKNPMSEDEMNERARKLGYRDIDEAIDAFVKYDREQNKKANSAAAERAEQKRQKLLAKGSTKQIEANLDKFTLAELKKKASEDKDRRDKEATIKEMFKARAEKKAEQRDLKQMRKESELIKNKLDAIDSGDPDRIKKYAKYMSTEELGAAIDRVNKVNAMNKLAVERKAENKAIAEAKRVDMADKVTGVWSATKYLVKTSFDPDKKVTIKELKQAIKDSKKKLDNVELKGAAKEAYEKNLIDATNKRATEVRDNILKYTGNKEAAEREAKKVLSALNGVKSAAEKERDKEAAKILNKAFAENKKKALDKAMTAARDKAENGDSIGKKEKAANKAYDEFTNPSKAIKKEKEAKKAAKAEKKAKEKSNAERMNALIESMTKNSGNGGASIDSRVRSTTLKEISLNKLGKPKDAGIIKAKSGSHDFSTNAEATGITKKMADNYTGSWTVSNDSNKKKQISLAELKAKNQQKVSEISSSLPSWVEQNNGAKNTSSNWQPGSNASDDEWRNWYNERKKKKQ